MTASLPPVTTPKPRQRPSKKPFEKVAVQKAQKPVKTYYKPVEEYDYYDDGEEKIVDKYGEGTKVVLHSKGKYLKRVLNNNKKQQNTFLVYTFNVSLCIYELAS